MRINPVFLWNLSQSCYLPSTSDFDNVLVINNNGKKNPLFRDDTYQLRDFGRECPIATFSMVKRWIIFRWADMHYAFPIRGVYFSRGHSRQAVKSKSSTADVLEAGQTHHHQSALRFVKIHVARIARALLFALAPDSASKQTRSGDSFKRRPSTTRATYQIYDETGGGFYGRGFDVIFIPRAAALSRTAVQIECCAVECLFFCSRRACVSVHRYGVNIRLIRHSSFIVHICTKLFHIYHIKRTISLAEMSLNTWQNRFCGATDSAFEEEKFIVTPCYYTCLRACARARNIRCGEWLTAGRERQLADEWVNECDGSLS